MGFCTAKYATPARAHFAGVALTHARNRLPLLCTLRRGGLSGAKSCLRGWIPRMDP